MTEPVNKLILEIGDPAGARELGYAEAHQVLPGKIHTVKYEQLIEQQEVVTRALLEHCELPWDEACMNFHQNKRAVQTHSSTQVRQKLYSDSVGRWKVYEEYLGPLLELENS